MEFRNQNDVDEIGTTTPSSLNHGHSSSIRASAFTKPTLSPSSSLISSRTGQTQNQGTGQQAARNGSIFLTNSSPSPSSLHLNPSTIAADHHHSSSQSLAKSPDPCPPSNSSPTSASTAKAAPNSGVKASPLALNSTPNDAIYRYKECLRNHAANIGVHVVDGCGEFMPDGEPSTPESLKCAACGCHRSFHRKESIGDAAVPNAGSPYYRAGTPARLPLLLPPPHPHHSPAPAHAKAFQLTGFPVSPTPALHGASGVMAFGGGANTSGSGGTTTESSSEERINAGTPTPCGTARKRFRTKFTADQKEKMLSLAERIGWRIQKQDEAMVEQFCAEAGIRRQVLKVWMHNNKHITKRQQQEPQLPIHQRIQSTSSSTMHYLQQDH